MAIKISYHNFRVCLSLKLSNRQLVSYCLLVDSIIEENEHSTKKEDLLVILTTANCSVVNASVAATFALLGRTVDIVTHSPFEKFDEWRSFYTTLNLLASNNVDEMSAGGVRLKKSILYCCDEDKWKFSDNDAYAEEKEKSLDQVFEEFKGEEVGQEEELSMKTTIKKFTDTNRSVQRWFQWWYQTRT